MGLLDDAIREHLELKRRHGASEDEVSHLETEVFGPARAAPEPTESPAQPVEPALEEDVDPRPHDDIPDGAGFDSPPPPDTPSETPVAASPPSFTDDEPWLDEPDEVPAGEALDHRRQATHEFTPEGVEDDEAPAEYVAPDEGVEEDVLEETPEFLQETPEHDRLWFEQKPPRDFDFGS